MDELERFFIPKRFSTPDSAFKPVSKLFGTSFATKYLEDDLQRIFKIVLEARTPTILFIVFSKGLYERLLKAKSLNIYYSKIF